MKNTDKEKKHNRIRLAVQIFFAAVFNGYAKGFTRGIIFDGGTKRFCVPVLNCYSCPGALGACPIGAMQAVATGSKRNFSFYAFGIIILFGVVLGRFICGFLCPFGLIQDLLAKIPLPKINVPKKLDKALRLLKYVLLVFFVMLLPAVVTNEFGMGDPWFCKYICPAGTLEGGIPLIASNSFLRDTLGALFTWKAILLGLVVIGSIFIKRFFCRYLCPLGALYSLFNKFSFYTMSVDKEKCVGCGKCEEKCPMAVDVTKNINSAECIRCGKCKAACPTQAIFSGLRLKGNNSIIDKSGESKTNNQSV